MRLHAPYQPFRHNSEDSSDICDLGKTSYSLHPIYKPRDTSVLGTGGRCEPGPCFGGTLPYTVSVISQRKKLIYEHDRSSMR